MDGKHTIFGKIVGGLETLTEMEKIEVDNKDCPIEDIIIKTAQVFVDPFHEAEEQLALERTDELDRQRKESLEQQKKKQANQPLKVYREGVGKYLSSTVIKETNDGQSTSNSALTGPVIKKKKPVKGGFGDFSSW